MKNLKVVVFNTGFEDDEGTPSDPMTYSYDYSKPKDFPSHFRSIMKELGLPKANLLRAGILTQNFSYDTINLNANAK